MQKSSLPGQQIKTQKGSSLSGSVLNKLHGPPNEFPSLKEECHSPYCMDEESEVQRTGATCSTSHSS